MDTRAPSSWFRAGAPAAALLLGLLLAAGCATPRPDAGRPPEHPATVTAALGWQPSGIKAWRGAVIHCRADGQWGDAFESYGPDGSPTAIKTHLGVSAPAHGLLMRLDSQTNRIYFIGLETNIVAERSGELQFRNNVSLTDGLRGDVKVRVTVARDADGDGVSDYDEIAVWKTDPRRADTDGDRLGDLDEIGDLGILDIPAPRGRVESQ